LLSRQPGFRTALDFYVAVVCSLKNIVEREDLSASRKYTLNRAV
jgi:hypothetical protein